MPDADPEIKKSTTDVPADFEAPDPIYESVGSYLQTLPNGLDADAKRWARDGYEVGQRVAIIRAIQTAAKLRALATLIILMTEQLD